MNILKTILENKELADKINYKCDIIIYPEMRKQEDADGHITWNIDGMAFGADASGGEFVLLSDGTIGFNSSEGETSRIAENMTELFELLINCPCFMDFLVDDIYKDDILLRKYAEAIESEYKYDFNSIGIYDWDIVKEEISKELGLGVDNFIYYNTLKKFYNTATREPQYKYIFKENDGTKIKSNCIISRPMRDWIKKKAEL
ncbi:hypothetical protein [Clostridium sp. ZBS3]|uniref:hypothetical protein n=1 Tax=Clostridium sp. ZBS3 TaxID=2949975 RepID=UPI001D49E715|nr:hypothetical protein [Clostridium sp. ZBS3]HBJ2621311.1 hypothetical protein [Clostridium botulinum]